MTLLVEIDARAASLLAQIVALLDCDGSATAKTGECRAVLVIEDDGEVVLYGNYPHLLQWSETGCWGRGRARAAASCLAYAIACHEHDYLPPLPLGLDH